MPLVEQEVRSLPNNLSSHPVLTPLPNNLSSHPVLIPLPNNLSSHLVLSGDRLAQSLVLFVVLYFCSIFAVGLSDLLPFTALDYSFGAFKLLLEFIHSIFPKES
jgi:hypothetical protein